MKLEFDDVLYILGYNDYEYEPTDKNIDAWRYVDGDILETDLEQGWMIQSLILLHIPTDKYFAVELMYIGGEGYELEQERDSLLTLDEVEPYEVTVTKYRLKNELHSQDKETDLGDSVPTTHPETT